MSISFSVIALAAVSALSLCLAVLNFSFWRVHREDRGPLWLAVWLAVSVVFTVCRLLQFMALSGPASAVTARTLLTAGVALAWLGYELANALIRYSPSRTERLAILSTLLVGLLLLWASDLILTDQAVTRMVAFGGQYHAVIAGPLYLPANLAVLALGALILIRLLRDPGSLQSGNRLIALGFGIVILSSLSDSLSVAFNLTWVRLMDFAYLPLAIFFTHIQVSRLGRLYEELDVSVQERTAELSQANEVLRAEVIERKQARDAQHVSEELYRMLFDANTHPAWIYDLQTLAFLLVNDAAVEHYGYSRAEFLQMTIQDIRPPEELPALQDNLAIHQETLQWSGPWKHRRRDGTVISVEIQSHSLPFHGKPARLVMANDITEHLQAMAALQESEEKYRALVEKSRDGIVIIQDGRVKFVNQRLADMRGQDINDILDTRFEEYVHPEERRLVLERYARRLSGEESPSTYETILQRIDGTRLVAEVTTGPITFQGKRAEIIIVRDVSERKQTERALQRQLREVSVLNTVATASSEATHVDGLIERITEAVALMLYQDNCGVLLTDERTQTWRPHPSYRGTSPEHLECVHPLSEGIAGKAIAQGRTIRVHDIHAEPAYQLTTPGIQSEMAVPIFVKGRVFGCINAESKALGAFTEHDERLMNTIAENMATAIEKIQLLQMEKRRRREAEILYNTTRDLVVERDLTDLLRIIVERAAGILEAPSSAMYLCEPGSRLVRCAVSFNAPGEYTGLTLRYGEGAAGTVAETGEALIISDYRTWEGRSPAFDPERPFISVLAVPMRWQGTVIGILHIMDNTRVRVFTDEDQRMVTLFANQAAMAVENARLFKEASQHAQEAAVLAEVGRDISETLELDVTLQRIASYAQDLLRARTCAVYLPEAGTSALRAVAALGPYAEEVKQDLVTLGEGILGSIARQRSGEIVNNVSTDPRAIHIGGTEELPIEHLMGVPVLTKDQLTGLIAIWRIGEGQEFNAAELNFLVRLAGQVGVAIENARLFEGTRRRLQEIEGLHVVSTALRTAQTLDEALPIILHQLLHLLNAGGASLEMIDPDGGGIITRRGAGAWEGTTGMRTPIGIGVIANVVATVQPYVTADVVADGKTGRPELFFGLRAAACVPVIAQHHPIGVLWIGRQTPILQEEVNLLAAIGEMVGNAIHRMMLNEETERRANEFESLYRSANGLAAQWDIQNLLEAVVTQARELLHSSGSDIYLYDPESGGLRVAVEKGGSLFLGTYIRVGEGMAGRVFQDQRSLIVDDYRTWESRAPQYEKLPIGAAVEVPVTFAGEKIGVLAAYEAFPSTRTYTEADARLLSLFATQAASAIRTARLLADLRGATSDLSLAYDTTLEGWAKALELRDKETLGHSRRVTDLTQRLARRMGVDESELTHIRRGVLLHDIGKMGIPDSLLKKTGPLNSDEWVEMRKHPAYAYDLLQPIAYLRPALDIPYCHHEQWDGSGYPRGLKGSEIPLAARIFTVVDVYDALSYDRAYRAAWPKEKVIEYIQEQSGRLFDPEITAAFLGLIHEEYSAAHEQSAAP